MNENHHYFAMHFEAICKSPANNPFMKKPTVYVGLEEPKVTIPIIEGGLNDCYGILENFGIPPERVTSITYVGHSYMGHMTAEELQGLAPGAVHASSVDEIKEAVSRAASEDGRDDPFKPKTQH